MFKEITIDQKQPIPTPLVNLRLKETKGRRKAMPPEMIQRILAPGAMEKLNEEARDVVPICLNTGCRPSEVCGVLPDHIACRATKLLGPDLPCFSSSPCGLGEVEAISARTKVELRALRLPLM